MALRREISRVLDPGHILMLDCRTKRAVFERMIECLSISPVVGDGEELSEAIFYREALMSTGIGLGIGVPHVRLESVEKPIMCVAVCHNAIADYESLDGEAVRLVFMIAAGKGQHVEHIRLLASISSRLKDEELRRDIVNAPDAETVHRILVGEA